MFLYRIHLNPRSRTVRRDIADPYQMHASLCRAFSPPEQPCPPGAVLWRLEPETDAAGQPRILVQSRLAPNWSQVASPDWLAEADMGIDLAQKLALDTLTPDRRFRFRLRANPCVTRNSKRLGLIQPDEQKSWLERQGGRLGFALPEPATLDYFEFQESTGRGYGDFRITQEQMLIGRQHSGNSIQVYSVLYEGRLIVTDPARFKETLVTGIGHGKVMGLGLLSVVPISG